jgi:hypothetical protein
MSISEHFRYRNDVFQSDIFVSDIGITNIDVGCRISPTLRPMSMPTYDCSQELRVSAGSNRSGAYFSVHMRIKFKHAFSFSRLYMKIHVKLFLLIQYEDRQAVGGNFFNSVR